MTLVGHRQMAIFIQIEVMIKVFLLKLVSELIKYEN